MTSTAPTGPLAWLRELVRIPSVNPDPDGEGAVAEALRAPLDAAGVDTTVLTDPSGRPSLVARLPGPTDRPPLVLVSHTDVVPVERDAWTRDPFGGEVHDGQLWGRGTLDMKGVTVLHAEALRALAVSGHAPTREVVLLAVADEEAGGAHGAAWLLRDHAERCGFRDGAPPPEVLGEGGFGLSELLPRPVLPIVVGEKVPLWLRATAAGEPGHGSMPPTRQAVRGLVDFLGAVSGHRPARLHPVVRDQLTTLSGTLEGAERRALQLLSGPAGPAAVRALAPALRTRLGVLGQLLADSVTPTRLDAGAAANVVPSRAHAGLDVRALPDTDLDALLAWLERVAGRHDVTIEVEQRGEGAVSGGGALFDLLADVSAQLPERPLPVASLTPGTTDLRFWRAAGATAYGWVPLVLTPAQLATFHGHDERVPVEGFAHAVTAMTDVVRRASVPTGPSTGNAGADR